MARNRQKASERKAARRDTTGDVDERSQPQEANVPNDWEHASGVHDQAEASIVAGAGGEVSDASDAELERQALEAAPATATAKSAAAVRATTHAPGAPTPRGVGRFGIFLKACWAELQRVQWPDRRQVGQATAVVIGFVIVAGAYLGLADRVAQKFVDFIL